METERSAKRRRLNTPSKLTAQSSSAARLAELRQTRSAKTGDANDGQPSALEDSPSIANGNRKPAKRSDTDAETGVGKSEGTNGHAEVDAETTTERNGVLGAKRKRQASTAKETSGSARKRQSHTTNQEQADSPVEQTGQINGDHEVADGSVGDVEMADADTITVGAGEDLAEDRRMSGRKRQVSRKLQEALVENSPILSARRKTVKTPIKVTKANGSKSTPKSTQKARTPKATRSAKSMEIQDTTDARGPQNGHAAVTVDEDAMDVNQPVFDEDSTKNAEPIVTKKTPKKAKGVPIDEEGLTGPEKGLPLPALKPSSTTVHPRTSQQVAEEDHLLIEGSIEEQDLPSKDIHIIQGTVLRQLTGRIPSRLTGLNDEYMKIANLIEQTIVAGESNSMMIIGTRGSGKTAVVEQILREQTARQGNDFHTVRLSGFTHTDDKIALREIWRQLGREMEVEDDHLAKNYADTLTTLLALLSHPSEHGAQQEGQIAKSVIIILDEFELFASHPRQTLLYNLFDIAQSRKAPIAVLGLTTRFDVAESLEKRVKSRFSHRQVYLPLARDFATFKEMCKSAVVIRSKDISPGNLQSRLEQSSAETIPGTSRKAWNAVMMHAFDKSQNLNHHLSKIYHRTKSVAEFNTSMLMPIASLSLDDLTTSTLLDYFNTSINTFPSLAPPDSKLLLLSSLSTLQLSLLIAAARISIIHDTDTCTFALAYDEYKNLASKARIQASAAGAMAMGNSARVWAKETARSAWQGLVELELIMPVNEARMGRDGGLCRVDVGLEEIGLAGVDMTGIMVRWCKEI